MKRLICFLLVLLIAPCGVNAATVRFDAYTNILGSSLTGTDELQVWNNGNIRNITVDNLWSYYTGKNTYQPLDSDLTYLAGVTLSNDIKTFLNAASAALAATALGLGTTDNPSFLSVHASGGNLAAANKQVVKAWQTGLPYVTQETAVVHGGKIYICTFSHTAGETTEPGVGADWDTVWAEVQGSGSMTYPGSGIPISTGSAWGTSLTASGALQYIRRNAANDGYEFGDLPAYPTQASLSVDDLITLSGVADGSINLGQFTGTTIGADKTIKAALQALETALEGIEVGGLSDLDDLPMDTVDDNLIDVGLIADLGPMIHGKTGKTTPVDADIIPLSDSADTWALKGLTWANLKATLKSYMDALYVVASGVDNITWGTSSGGSQTWTWDTGSGTDPSLTVADDSFTANKKIVAPGFETNASDGTHHMNVDNSTSYSGTTQGDIYTIAGVPYVYRTAARQIWDAASMPYPAQGTSATPTAGRITKWDSSGRVLVDGPEIAAASDINTGTATDKLVTPDALAGSDLGAQHVCWVIVKSDTVTAVAYGKDAFVVPTAMNGMNITDLTCSVSDLNSASGGSTDVVVRRVRGATAADMTSTACTITYTDYTASDETVDTSNDDIQTGDKIFVDVNAVTTGAVQKGLSCTATFAKP